MSEEKTLILDQHKIKQKVDRMAYQIMEHNYQEEEMILAGIKGGGYFFAEKLYQSLSKITDIKINLLQIAINKKDPLNEEVHFENGPKSFDGKTVILVDDVANTGKTIFYAMKPLLDSMPKKVQLAVLVDRRHKLFPIVPDYTGISLSTTIQEHISVEITKKKEAVYLL